MKVHSIEQIWLEQALKIQTIFFILFTGSNKGAFNKYVDKIRGGGGQKMSVFVHVVVIQNNWQIILHRSKVQII